MRLIAIFVTLLLAGVASAAAARGRFAGHWVATFKGTDICILEIEESGDKVTGYTKFCKISVDQNGDLVEAEAPDGTEPDEPFFNQQDDAERMKFELKLTAEGKAELRIVDTPVAIKPIRFERR